MKSCPACKATYPTEFSHCPKDGTTLRPVTELEEGAVIRGKYEIRALVGRGGMGSVYKAWHLVFHEICALKVVKAQLLEEPEFLKRFRAEALVMRRLRHPNAVQVSDYDETEDGRPFLVMEYVEGESLDKLLAVGKPLEPWRAIGIASQVCAALAAAHALGILHRDIKPSNILVTRTSDATELAKVLDFGVAKVKEQTTLLYGHSSLTGTGFVVGTPAYMLPEQARGVRGDQLDGRSDLYSLGVVLFEMLTGRLPFEADTPVAAMLAHVQTPPPDPRTLRPELPAPLVNLVLRALQKEPGQRFASADAMREALEVLHQVLGAPSVRPAIAPAIPPAPPPPPAPAKEPMPVSPAPPSPPAAEMAAPPVGEVGAREREPSEYATRSDAQVARGRRRKRALLALVAAIVGLGLVSALLWERTKAWPPSVPRQAELKFQRSLAGHERGVWGLAFSPDGQFLASRGDKSARVWNINNGQLVRELEPTDKQFLWAVAFSPSGRWLAVGGHRKTSYAIQVWDLSTGKTVEILRGSGRVDSLTFSPDGRLVAAGGWDSVIVWDASTWQQVLAFAPEIARDYKAVHVLAFSPDSQRLAAGGKKSVVIFDLATGQRKKLPERAWGMAYTDSTGMPTYIEANWLTSLAFSPDGHSLALGLDIKAVVWDSRDDFVRDFNTGTTEAVGFTRDGQWLIAATNWGAVQYWQLTGTKTVNCQASLSDRPPFSSVAFASNGLWLAEGQSYGDGNVPINLWQCVAK